MAESFRFDFHGYTDDRVRGATSKDSDPSFEIVRQLNEKSALIAARIRRELSLELPRLTEVDVKIDFYSGSIEWVGLVTVMDSLSRISGSVAAVEYLSKVIRFAVNHVLRAELEDRARQFRNPETTVRHLYTQVEDVLAMRADATIARPGLSLRNLLLVNMALVVTAIVLVVYGLVKG